MPNNKKTILKVILIGGVVCSLTVVWLFGSSGKNTRRPERYLLPNNYTGYFRVDYGIKDAPPLPIENGFYVYRIPLSGYLKTSSLPQEGVATDEFYYVTKTGWQRVDSWSENPRVWASTIVGPGIEVYPDGKRNRTSTYQQTFIGTEQQWKNADHYHIGPININQP